MDAFIMFQLAILPFQMLILLAAMQERRKKQIVLRNIKYMRLRRR